MNEGRLAKTTWHLCLRRTTVAMPVLTLAGYGTSLRRVFGRFGRVVFARLGSQLPNQEFLQNVG